MTELVIAVAVTWLAGLAAYAGGLLARWERIPESAAKQELIHDIVAFGGGLLVAAIAFALVPEGMSILPPVHLAGIFCFGGVAFCAIDAYLSRQGGSRAPTPLDAHGLRSRSALSRGGLQPQP